MYKERLSESRGVRIATRVVILAGVTVGVFAAFGSTAGIAVFAAGIVIGLLLELRPDRRNRHPLTRAAEEGGLHRGKHVLVVANTALKGDQLAQALKGPAKIDVLAPPLTSPIHMVMSDTDHEVADAEKRLQASLDWAARHGIEVRGEVGDPDAITGMADELRGFGADAVVVVSEANAPRRLPRRELERLKADLDIPVTEVAV